MNENKDQSAGNLQRAIQQEQDGRDAAAESKRDSKPPVQTGSRSQPIPPLPAQHLAKPGSASRFLPCPPSTWPSPAAKRKCH